MSESESGAHKVMHEDFGGSPPIEIHDRILDAYYGRMGEEFMRKTRLRIHWICSSIVGLRVLDIGCSQGIVPLLLGREAFHVLGIDSDQKAIDVANAHLAHEISAVRDRVTFVCADALSFDYGERTFETIVLSEVLEHTIRPALLLDLAASLLQNNGVLIVTLPFGINDFVDHKKSYYLSEAYSLLYRRYEIEEVENFGRWIGLRCRLRDKPMLSGPENIPFNLVAESEAKIEEIERDQLSQIADLKKRLGQAHAGWKDAAALEAQNQLLLAESQSECQVLRNKLADAEKMLANREREIEEADERQLVSEQDTRRLEVELCIAKSNCDQLNERCAELKALKLQSESDRRQLLHRLSDADQTVLSLRAEVARVVEAGRLEIEALNTQNQSRQELLSRYEFEVRALDSALDEFRKAKEAAESERGNLIAKLLVAEEVGLRREVSETQKMEKLEELRAQTDNLEAKCIDLISVGESQRVQMETIREQFSCMQALVATLTEEIAQYAGENRGVGQELLDAVKSLSNAGEAAARCELELSGLRAREGKAEEYANLLRGQLDAVEGQQDWWRNSALVAMKENYALKDRLEKSRIIEKDMQARIEGLKFDLAQASRLVEESKAKRFEIEARSDFIQRSVSFQLGAILVAGSRSPAQFCRTPLRLMRLLRSRVVGQRRGSRQLVFSPGFPSPQNTDTPFVQAIGPAAANCNLDDRGGSFAVGAGLALSDVAPGSLACPKLVRVADESIDSAVILPQKSDGLLLSFGISVVVPTIGHHQLLERCLQSLADQRLEIGFFEVIVVLNVKGVCEETERLVEEFRHKGLDVKLIVSSAAGASAARNHGAAYANKAYITFVDDDDYVSPNYLASHLLALRESTVSVSYFMDSCGGRVAKSTYISGCLDAALEISGRSITWSDLTPVFSMNAAKAFPTGWARRVLYDPTLKSGEDVEYWARMICTFDPEVTLEPARNGGVYYRVVTGNSVSRQQESLEFNVRQRLDVIQRLDGLLAHMSKGGRERALCESRIRAQADFMVRYVGADRERYAALIDVLESRRLSFDLLGYINGKLSKTLIIAYCFPPYVDTSGVVVAKRIRAMGEPADVIYCAMKNTRKQDPYLERICAPFLASAKEIEVPESFANWKAIERFCDAALLQVDSLVLKGRQFEKLYSRVLWPASNFVAAAYKIRNPGCRWVAEFSDPVLVDIEGGLRKSDVSVDWLQRTGLLSALRSSGIAVSEEGNLFELCELLAYVLADEVVFTNEHQLSYMMSYLGNSGLVERVLKKATISRHPTLPRRYYIEGPSRVDLDSGKINVGYFGAFYKNRGLDKILDAVCQLSDEEAAGLKVYIYSEQASAMREHPVFAKYPASIVCGPSVGYFDFLAASDCFDWLVVNDTVTAGAKLVNPYLPSKLSDYLGSRARIWALVEAGSAMDGLISSGEISVGAVSSCSCSRSILSTLKSLLSIVTIPEVVHA